MTLEPIKKSHQWYYCRSWPKKTYLWWDWWFCCICRWASQHPHIPQSIDFSQEVFWNWDWPLPVWWFLEPRCEGQYFPSNEGRSQCTWRQSDFYPSTWRLLQTFHWTSTVLVILGCLFYLLSNAPWEDCCRGLTNRRRCPRWRGPPNPALTVPPDHPFWRKYLEREG